MNPFAAIAEARLQLQRSAAAQILAIAVLQFGLAAAHDFPPSWIALGALLAAVALPSLFSPRPLPAASFAVPLSLLLLVAPWWLGGVRHPVVLLPIVGLHVGAFLLGVRPALWMASAFLANLAALTLGERRGWFPGRLPDTDLLVFYVAATAFHALFFISTPLDVVRQLLSGAEQDLAARNRNETLLRRATDALEDEVAARSRELTGKRVRLGSSLSGIDTATARTLVELRRASRDLAASLAEGPDNASAAAARIAAECARMERMHGALHQFCRLGQESLQTRFLAPAPHARLVREAWDEAKTRDPDRFASFVLGVFPEVVADPALLRQVWASLLRHAHTNAQAAREPAVRVSFTDGEFAIEDNGPALEPADAERLFDLFHHLRHPGGPGSDGIALAVAKRIVEMHGGVLRADSGPDRGNAIRFSLRADPPSSEEASP